MSNDFVSIKIVMKVTENGCLSKTVTFLCIRMDEAHIKMEKYFPNRINMFTYKELLYN